MKDWWMIIGIMVSVMIFVGIVGAACIFFQKVWEHINQEPPVTILRGHTISVLGKDASISGNIKFDVVSDKDKQ